MTAQTKALPASSPSSAWQNFPAALPENFDYLDFDPHVYMESSGFNAAVDQAFAPVFIEIAAQTDQIRANLEKLFQRSND
jgi:hypothetical protein